MKMFKDLPKKIIVLTAIFVIAGFLYSHNEARAAVSIRNVGAYVSGTANLTPGIPATAGAGDMMLLIYGTKPYNDAPTINQGWTSIGSATDGTIATTGNDIGSMQTRIYYKEHTGSETNPTITNTTNSVSGAVIIAFQKAGSEVWGIPVGAGGGDATAGTNFSVTASANPGITSGDMLVGYAAIRSNLGTQSGITITATGLTVSAFTESPATDLTTTSGNNMAMSGGYSLVSSGTASAAPVYASTLAASHTGSAFIVRLRALAAPTLTTPTAASITSSGATLGASITSDGGAAITARGTCWGTAPAPMSNCASEGGTATGAFTQARTGMSASTSYYYRGYATNSAGTGYSGDGTFTTSAPAPVAPTLTTPTAVSITSSGATLGANITSDGGAAITARGTCWGTAAAPTSNCLADGLTATGVFTQARTGMSASTFYYYRGYATNSAGTGYSSDGTFTTSAPAPVAPTLTTPTAVSITSSGATLGANITSDGGAAITARGTCWGTAAAPTSNCLADGLTATGVFTQARTGMSASTFYYYRGYATNSAGTGYSGDGTFTTSAISDTTPPALDPMTFASIPTNDSAVQISMTGTTATDADTPPVGYYFALDTASCTVADIGTGAADSGWQAGTTYSDAGLDANKCYGYKVKARDSVGTPNETGYSGITTLYTSANTPGTPTLIGITATTLSLTNAENGNPASNPTTYFAVQVVTTSPADGAWLNQWVSATGNPSATEVWMTDAQLDVLVLQSLQTGTLYGVKVKARNNDGDETALSAQGQGTPSPTPATTLGTGTDPDAIIVAPESGIRDAGAFTLVTNTGTDTVTAVTVTLAASGAPYAGLSEARITSDDGSVVYFNSVTGFSGNTVSFSGGTSIPVDTAPVQFKIRLTPLGHTAMPAPSTGTDYNFTAYVSAFTATNIKVTSDDNANTLTIDNASPANAASASGTAGSTQVTLNWTNPGDADFQKVIIYCKTASITEVPTEGTDPGADGAACDATARVKYSGTVSPQTFTGLSNDIAYYYKIFSKDANGNYATGTDPAGSPFTPVAITYTITASSGANGVVTPSGTTTVAQAGSKMYAITPASGYDVATVTVDSVSVATSTSYAFTDVQANHTINATFAALPSSSPVTPPVDTTPTPSPVTYTITGGAGGAAVIPPGTITFTGKAFPKGEISITSRELREEKGVRRTITTNDDGSFSLSFIIDPPQGLYSLALLAKDSMGRVSQTKVFSIDTHDQKPSQKNLILPPTIDLPAGRVSRGKTATIIGSGSPGGTIHLELDGIIKSEGVVDHSGSYSFSLPTGALDFGTHTVRTRQTDASSGQISDFSVSRAFIVSNLSVIQTDINGDGKIDIKDWSIFLARFASRDKEVRKSIDFTGDGKVDIADFSIFIKTIRKR